MIRFLQTPGPIKKVVLGGLLVFISAMMAISLIPGIGGSNFLGSGTPARGVVATVDGADISTQEVQRQAKEMIQQQYPQAGAQAGMLVSFFAKPAADNLINEKIILLSLIHI